MLSHKMKLLAAVLFCAVMAGAMIKSYADPTATESTQQIQGNNQSFNEELQKFKDRKKVGRLENCYGYTFCASDLVDACRHVKIIGTNGVRIINHNEKPLKKSDQDMEKSKEEAAHDLGLSTKCISYASGFIDGQTGSCRNVDVGEAYGLAMDVIKKYDKNPDLYKNLSSESIFKDVYKEDFCKNSK